MGKAIPTQHPAVVLRSHYLQLRALLAVAMIAVVGLTATVVILSVDEGDKSASTAGAKSGLTAQEKRWAEYNEAISSLTPEQLAAAFGTRSVAPDNRYDGGPEEGTSGALFSGVQPGIRYDGGPEEGTSGALSSGADSNAVPGIRYDGGPEEGTSGALSSGVQPDGTDEPPRRRSR
jgi:hypothetical protein